MKISKKYFEKIAFASFLPLKNCFLRGPFNGFCVILTHDLDNGFLAIFLDLIRIIDFVLGMF